jgi:hypothetical protein
MQFIVTDHVTETVVYCWSTGEASESIDEWFILNKAFSFFGLFVD